MRSARIKPVASALIGLIAALTIGIGSAKADVRALDVPIVFSTDSASTCTATPFRPYAEIGDERDYVTAPGGTFDGALLAGWQLRDGATLDQSSSRGAAIALPAGASAISPMFCVDLLFPHARLAHRTIGGDPDGLKLRIEVVYPLVTTPVWTEVKAFDGFQGDAVADDWRISPDIALKPTLGGQLPGPRYAALRITAHLKDSSATGAVLIDDLNIDPRMH